MNILLDNVISTIIAAPIYTGIVLIIIRVANKKRKKTLKFLSGTWISEYQANELSDKVTEKIFIKENIWRGSLIVRSIESNPHEYSWEGELFFDDNDTAFGSWVNTINPTRCGYCVFHITRENILTGYAIVTKRDSLAERSVLEWKVFKQNPK